jgi:hypothetical protein
MQDAAVLKRDYGIALAGVINTQLLAGLVTMSAAAGQDSCAAAAASCTYKRLNLRELHQMFGFEGVLAGRGARRNR